MERLLFSVVGETERSLLPCEKKHQHDPFSVPSQLERGSLAGWETWQVQDSGKLASPPSDSMTSGKSLSWFDRRRN